VRTLRDWLRANPTEPAKEPFSEARRRVA
jgi:hypothetical protein